MGLCVPNSFTYNCLLDAISKGGDVGLTELRLKEMCSYGWELDNKWGKVDKAFELVERIEDLNISLNEKTCFVLTHGFVRESRTDKAVQLLDKMKKMGFVMDIFDYGVLIEEFSRDKEIEKAIELYEDMNVSGKGMMQAPFSCEGDVCAWSSTFGEILHTAHAETLQRQASNQVFNFLADMVQEGYLPDVVGHSAVKWPC
ncbi:hypothetical protein CQW23_00710 [Capsicum baccatum]|uniref:Pentatricopeptide repeat-containing protein n=1 Tax=Capsicum baccatum TaxID=33114 RepID=A0A2G2XLI7_CAPBA|nr:hypothetical protein CQW23_00710 [Capsicum baccatum]